MKRLASILAALLLLAALALPAAAAEPERCIYDTAKLLPDDMCVILDDIAQNISRERQCSVYFMTVENFQDYGDGVIFDVARQIFLDNKFGMGENQDGVLLILSMADRDYCLLAHGFGDTALTDYGKDYISENFLDNFADDDWYGGCLDYLTYTDSLLEMAREGKIYDVGSWVTSVGMWVCSLPAAMLIALIVCSIQRMLMKKKVRMQSGAAGYLEGDVKITRNRDVFTHSTEIRQKIETEKSASSGGHTHTSDGFSGKSGKF